MNEYYTRACNFYYGTISKTYIREKKSIPLNGYNHISFDKIEIIDRKKIVARRHFSSNDFFRRSW